MPVRDRELHQSILTHQGVAIQEEVVEDTESGVISMVEVPVDHMEEDLVSERRSFGDLNQGVVLDKSPIK